jgi:decaprenylphospho-beta-D-erythro-pentofuranosid-2-ulose 2-reductase
MAVEFRHSVVLLGSTSGMMRATADAFAATGYALVLAARDDEENTILASDLALRHGVPCHALHFDAAAVDTHEAFVAECEAVLGTRPTGLVLGFGYMAAQEDAQRDMAETRAMIDVNLIGTFSILERFAAAFEDRGSGFMGVLSSVAGERGKPSNYIYGATKAGLTCYLEGLRVRLHKSNVTVTTIQPGFVDTPMTYGLPLPGPLVASPAQAGKAIFLAVTRGKDVAYVPFFWRYIMCIIRCIPRWQFKKMNM